MPSPSQGLTITAVVFGWIYFTCWSVSFYPQVWTNFCWRSTAAVSYDFAIYNVVGFVALTAFDLIHWRIQSTHDLTRAIEVQDVAFAIHATALSLVLLMQIFQYDRHAIQLNVTRTTILVSVILYALVILHIILYLTHVFPLCTFPGIEDGMCHALSTLNA